MKEFNYRNFYQKYDMTGDIQIGTGIVRVHDIFGILPQFMLEADCLFIDPPCSEGNLKSFYTKAKKEKINDIVAFNDRLFELINIVNPAYLFVEVFASNKDDIIDRIYTAYGRYPKEFLSYYYQSEKNKCFILYISKGEYEFELPYVDEEKIIEYICQNLNFQVIGDLCMGKGLVGFYANKYNKRFVGTELNEKRLACLLEHIKQNKIIVR